MKEVYVAFSYGQGGPLVDYLLSFNGSGVLDFKFEQMGCIAPGPFAWSDTAKIADRIRALPLTMPIAVAGTSLGANEAPRIGAMLLQSKRTVDLMVGIQPSTWGAKNLITSNVKRAVCFYNPIAGLTGGLGSYCWKRTEGNHTTELLAYRSYWPHPGDNVPWIHEIIFAELRKLQ